METIEYEDLSADDKVELKVVGKFDVAQGVTLNQCVYFETGLPDGSYTLVAIAK